MSGVPGAVFLSYASQDAAAAQRICEALRAAGVEVWFDQNELVGGDAWDAKIRKQIKDCALFVPMISAATQARAEGYFRREWKLAVERTHDMADHVPFLVPVVIDGTGDAEAFVPEKFREVQWTRLPGGEPTAKFCDRVQTLLHGGPARPVAAAAAARSNPESSPAAAPARPRWRLPALAGVVTAIAVGGWLWFGRTAPKPAPGGSPAVAAAPTPAAAPLTEAQKLTRQARSLIDDPMDVRENYFLADELAHRAVAADPTDGEAWALAGRVSALMAQRKFDVSSARKEQMRMQVERAMSLAPTSTESQLAQALKEQVVGRRDEARRMLEELTKHSPNAWQAQVALIRLLEGSRRHEEALELSRRVQAMPGGAVGAAELEAWVLLKQLRLAEARAKYEECLAVQPSRMAYYRQLLFLGIYLYDVPATRTLLERIPARVRQEDGVISTVAEFYLRTGEGDLVLQELKRMPRDFFEDGWDWRPKGYLAGYAHQVAGRAAAAQAEWKQALAVVEKRLAAEPNQTQLLYWKCVLLALTGQTTEARAGRKLLLELKPLTAADVWFDAILLVALGEREEAITSLEKNWPTRGPETRNDLWGDFLYAPWFAAIRDDPRIRAMAAEHQAAIKRALQPPAADQKVAVLAFANLSDDKANEYFSDGISEELLNVLARVPGLQVSARTSAFSFKGRNVPIPEIAQQLGVAYIVEGSVRKAGSQVRITAQLVKAADGFQLWSETFTRDLKDIFAVQDEIAGLIAQKLSLKLGAGAAAAISNPEAYRLYLEGRAAWNRRNAEGFRQAELLLNRALELEPRFARAHAALADVWSVSLAGRMGSYGQRQSPYLEKILAKATQAVALDENSAEAHASLGQVHGLMWRIEESLREFRRAIELNPNYASAHQWLGRKLVVFGHLEEGRAALQRAAELDPLSHRILDNYSDALRLVGRLDEARAALQRAAALHPTGVQIRCKLAQILARMGRRDEALAAARALAAEVGAEEPDYRYSTAVGVLSQFGEEAEATAVLRRVSRESEDYPVALAGLGRIRDFTRQLDDVTINWTENLLFEPAFAPIRADPEFRAWTKKVGLAEALSRAETWLAAHPPEKPGSK